MLRAMKSSFFRCAIVTLFAAAVVAGSWLSWLDASAEAYSESGLKRSLATFALARTLGAALSVAQGTKVSLEPGGIGMSFAPGEVLQPVKELVDKFADVMLVASVAFGIQLLLLKIGAHQVVSVLLTAAVLIWAVAAWRSRMTPLARCLSPILIALLLVRFAAPLISLANEGAYRTFMANEYQVSLGALEDSSKTVPESVSEPSLEKGSFFEVLRKGKESLASLRATFKAVTRAAGEWADKIVRLIAIFMIQTVLLPIVFLWVLWRMTRIFVVGALPSVEVPASRAAQRVR
jgi:hypothetical protein